jgi:malate dehydrogenase (oxaloacetate-decarboxylating)(NADP+)
MLVREGLVDGQVHGVADSYPNAIRPVLQVIDRRPGVSKVSGLYLMISKNRTLLFADATVNIQPNAEELAEIAILAGEVARFFDMEPRVAMLSFSNFGSVRHPEVDKVTAAMDIVRRRRPDLLIDGEMQADTAVVDTILNRQFPFNRLGQSANVLIFPDLTSGNVSYKLLDRLGGAKAIGPLLMGLSRPFNVVQRNSDMENVSTIIAFTVAQAQNQKNFGSMEE